MRFLFTDIVFDKTHLVGWQVNSTQWVFKIKHLRKERGQERGEGKGGRQGGKTGKRPRRKEGKMKENKTKGLRKGIS